MIFVLYTTLKNRVTVKLIYTYLHDRKYAFVFFSVENKGMNCSICLVSFPPLQTEQDRWTVQVKKTRKLQVNKELV